MIVTQTASFQRVHFWMPLGGFVLLWSIATLFNLDRFLATQLFGWEHHRWLFKHSQMFEHVLHPLQRDLSTVAWLIALVAWCVSLRRPSMAACRKPLGYLVLSVLLSTTLVAVIKSHTNMDCPWDLNGLGGSRPYIPLFTARPAWLPHNACFPAGHASAGYAWLSLYFFFLMSRSAWRWHGLAIGAGAGLFFGITQQLRGAHFFTHDLTTAAICWFVAYGLYRALRPRQEILSANANP